MPSKGVQDRVVACAPALWAAFAYSEFVAEAIRRLFPELEARLHERQAKRVDVEPQAETLQNISVPGLMRGAGAALDAARDRMVTADRARERQKATLEQERRRRDELTKTIYRRVVWARDMFEKRIGRRRTTAYLAVTGETPRDPQALLGVARLVADRIADPEVALASPAPGVQVREQKVALDLRTQCADLETTLKTISSQASEEKAVISFREQRVAEFDELHGLVARYLETLLDLVEMPTLAAAVRPEVEGTGRRGRPSKQPPRDLFPDLVVAALDLDPRAGLTLQELRDLVPRRPVEYRRRQDVPARKEVLKALVSEAAAFRGEAPSRPDETVARAPDRLDPEALGGSAAVEGLKGWLADVGRALLGRKESP